MKVLMIEDEAIAAAQLKRLLQQVDRTIEPVATLETVEDSVNWLSAHPAPELIFMDIQLDDGLCFEIFDAVKVDSPVIFTTAYDQFAIRAFKVNSVDYLLKPITAEALRAAIQKYRSVFTPGSKFQEQARELHRQLAPRHKMRFFVNIGAHFQSVPTSNISCFFIEERCTFLKTGAGKRYSADYSLDQLQKMLDPARFFRINRNYIIHIDAIADITGYSAYRLKVKLKPPNEEELVVSRERVGAFKEWLGR
ncbi:MAG: response regulator transcription factor [Phaeodactylibacter sp.]|nr:response regulator transcription factor [Phaeodactylibacter sp.]